MWWKFLVFVFLVFALFAEREVNSKTEFYKMDSSGNRISIGEPTGIDSALVFKSWCDYLNDNGIRFAEVVVAQIVHETGWFTSVVYKENNNCFGMKENELKWNRKKICVGTKNGHAAYKSRLDSIKNYRVYQNRMLALASKQGRTPHTNEDYMALLEDLPHLRGKRYAEDLKYIEKLRMQMSVLKKL